LGKGRTEQTPKIIENVPPPPLEIVKANDSVFQNYNNYIQAKRDYQMRNIPKDKLLYTLEVFSQELKDFFAKLYRNTDTPEEREIIISLINNINTGNI
jgi:hypothetical protein